MTLASDAFDEFAAMAELRHLPANNNQAPGVPPSMEGGATPGFTTDQPFGTLSV